MNDNDKTPKVLMIRLANVDGFCRACMEMVEHSVHGNMYTCLKCGKETVVGFIMPRATDETKTKSSV